MGVIHGCVDGFSRPIIYLKCISNNLSETVLDLFLDAVKRDGDRWPSRIRVDRRVENVLVCDAMIQYRGEGRASFIAGPSRHNQRIERLCREVYRCVCHLYYYNFLCNGIIGGFLMSRIQFSFSLTHYFYPQSKQLPERIF